MVKLKEAAENYVPTKTKNVVELEAVSLSQDFDTAVRKDSQGDDYTISFIKVNGEEYRVPKSVLEQLKAIIKEKPSLKTVKVTREGEGMNTKYTVIQLE